MYKVVSYEWNQSMEQLFDTVEEAFKAQQEWDPKADIECYRPEGYDVVWTREFEDYVSPDAFWINTNTNLTGNQTITLV